MGEIALSLAADFDHPLPQEDRIFQLVQMVFSGENQSFKTVGVILADHKTVLKLNQEWLGHDYNTDVLSFKIEERPLEAEVYVDVETAAERHSEFGADVIEEIERYLVHGLLHLCGYDDTTDEERQVMKGLEDRYLNSSG